MRLLLPFLLLPLLSFSQLSIKGKVTDSRGEVLPFTNIVSLKKNIGTMTNEKGEFKLNFLEENDTVKITNIAFIAKLIPIQTFSNGNVIVLPTVSKIWKK